MHFKTHAIYKLKFYIIKFDRYATIPSSYCKLMFTFTFYTYPLQAANSSQYCTDMHITLEVSLYKHSPQY